MDPSLWPPLARGTCSCEHLNATGDASPTGRPFNMCPGNGQQRKGPPRDESATQPEGRTATGEQTCSDRGPATLLGRYARASPRLTLTSEERLPGGHVDSFTIPEHHAEASSSRAGCQGLRTSPSLGSRAAKGSAPPPE